MKTNRWWMTDSLFIVCGAVLFCPAALGALPGPTPVVPEGGGAPGAYPNSSASGINVVAKGSASGFTSDVEVPAIEGQGPIPWVINRYNRGDFAMRLAPADSAAANANTLNKGFTQFNGANDASLPENHAWRPDASRGVVIPTARQNGPIDWQDGVGGIYPTVAVALGSSGYGYSMLDGSFGTGHLDVNTGAAGNPSSESPEANFSFSATWFPFDAGWIGGNMGNPDATTGAASWNEPGQHSVGLAAGLMTWFDFPDESMTFVGLGQLHLPGINALEDGMLFTTSSQGGSDVNIVGVAPTEDATSGASGWLVTVREDSAVSAEEIVGVGQCQFMFVYVPYTAQNLVGGYIDGSTGVKIKSAGTFNLTRTGTGTYEFSVAGKSATDGTLLLQVADVEEGTSVPMASRAFLSYQADASGKFVIQSRKVASDTAANLADADFYVAWVDFAAPMSMPDGPRLRSRDAVAVTDVETINARTANLAVNTDEPEILVTTVDLGNSGGYVDATTGAVATDALIGYFYDSRTLALNRGPFLIMGNSSGAIDRQDVEYNPVSREYNVVICARGHSSAGTDELMIARVKPGSVAGENDPVAKVFTYDGLLESFASALSYDDVALAVSTKNGNFIVVAEHKQDSPSGEGTFGALFGPDGTVLTATPTLVSLLQATGDVDDPDVVYLPKKDAFLYISNTDMSGGLANRIVGSVIQTTAADGKLQVSGPEQVLAADTGASQGHPAAIENPSNGEVITAYDFGNGTAQGNLSYYTIGAGPGYAFTEARAQGPYLNGTGADPFHHQHPQLAADPESGIIAVGYQSVESGVGYPNAYVFNLLDKNGAPLAGPFGDVPYFLTDSRGAISTSVNYHNIVFDPQNDAFVVAFNAPTPGGANQRTYLSAFNVSTAAATVEPSLAIARDGANVIIRWPASATGFVLESTTNLGTSAWQAVPGAPVPDGQDLKVTVPATGTVFYRLRK
ncbi:MAG: hypothetical protein AB9869_06430 [Verrucomicrobiia bacterium]